MIRLLRTLFRRRNRRVALGPPSERCERQFDQIWKAVRP